jgi:uncharacterized SAM-binding protein YcdF (DUF218 family)
MRDRRILAPPSGTRKRYGVSAMDLVALVLLGCRLEPEGRLSPAAQRRVQVAARAFHAGQAPRIVVSGGRRWFGVAEADAMARALVDQRVPEQQLVLEWLSASTAENALYSARLLPAQARVGVVTCDWHMRRALACFRRVKLLPSALAAASPSLPVMLRARRGARERLSAWLDRIATWQA